MLTFAYENLPHVLCALLLISRIGDIGTTYLVSPKLILEANPIVRKLGWPFALFTLTACLLPYFSLEGAVMALMVFLLVSAHNAAKIWITRTIGEEAYAAFVLDLARKSKPSHALFGLALSTFFVALAGATILLFYPSPEQWGFWLGLGIVFYAGAVAFYGTLATLRLFRRAAVSLPNEGVTRPAAS